MKRTKQIFSYEDKYIEFSIVGTGTPILVFHGGHSNSDEEFGYKSLAEQFMLITPSRAGYGKTSKEMGGDLSVACHYYLKLLNHLKIEKVHIIAISAGGPTGIYFAAKYPDRVQTLTLQSAVTKEWLTPKDITYKVASVLFKSPVEKMTWRTVSLLSNWFPTFIYRKMAPNFSKLSIEKIKQRTKETDIEEIRKMNNRQHSGHGFLIDIDQTNIPAKTLQKVTCPTLVMYSENDASVSVDHAYHANKNIASSQLCKIDSWGHLIWLSETIEEVDQTLISFMRSND